MSAARAATTIAKHTRTLSQPSLRRTFYTPFAALQHSPLLSKPPTNSNESGASGGSNAASAAAAAGSSSDGVTHEHEREHAARTVHVVSEPNAADFKYGVPAGAYPNATPYNHHHSMAHGSLENVSHLV
jgi:hypothetical protein